MADNRCPLCQAETTLTYSCPSYGNPAMSCFPTSSCGNALDFDCTECDFYFTYPRNEFASNYAKCMENKALWNEVNESAEDIVARCL